MDNSRKQRMIAWTHDARIQTILTKKRDYAGDVGHVMTEFGRRRHLCGTRPAPSMSADIAACPSYHLYELTLMLIRETIRPPRTFFINPMRLIQRTWGRWRLEESPFMRWRFQPVWPSLPTLKNLAEKKVQERASPIFLLPYDTLQNRARKTTGLSCVCTKKGGRVSWLFSGVRGLLLLRSRCGLGCRLCLLQ
jgi:hypothetical protein